MSSFSQKELENALRQCEAEPIHQIGKIQPHGALLALSANKQRIVLQASDNLSNFLDLPLDGVHGKSLASLIGIYEAERIEELIRDVQYLKVNIKTISVTCQQVQHDLLVHIYPSDDMFVLELTYDENIQKTEQFVDLLLSMQHVLLSEKETDIYRYFNSITSITRELFGFDRVMCYRFDSQWDGEVIAESRSDSVTSYLGLRFPASDIPPQARRLYMCNLVRHVTDIDAKPVDISPALNPVTLQPLDMTYSALRSFSRIHIEYLRNMGVKASMSISLLKDGNLWGLIACHHMTAKSVPNAMQNASTIISKMVSSKLSLNEFFEQRHLETGAVQIVGNLLKSIMLNDEHDIRQSLLPNLVKLLDATGVILIVEGKQYTCGVVPSSADINILLAALGNQPQKEIFCSDHLQQQLTDVSPVADIVAGLLASPITQDMHNCIIWLRQEKLRSVKWAGKPEKNVLVDPDVGLRITPRQSFESWTELSHGHSKPWSLPEIEFSRILSSTLIEGINHKCQQKEIALSLKQYQSQLQDYQQLMNSVIDCSPSHIFALDLQNNFILVNEALASFNGMSKEDVLGKTLYDIFPKRIADRLMEDNSHVMATGKVTFFEEAINNSFLNDPRFFVTSKFPLMDAQGKITGMGGVATDITDRKLVERELAIAATAFESLQGMMITDSNNIVIRVNKAFTRMTGYTADEIIGKKPNILQSGRQDATFYSAMWECITQKGGWEGEIWNRRKSGEIYPEFLSIAAVKDIDGNITNYVAALADITLSFEAAEQIKRLAYYDPLTQLPNRRLLMDRLHQAKINSARSNKYGALLFIDLDHFKVLNDTLGHDYGDELLIQVAQRLSACFRDGDTLARFGGDEFVAMLEEMSEDAFDAAKHVETVGVKILAAFSSPYLLIEQYYQSTPSIGITLFKDKVEPIDALLKRADIAMYAAKAAGRNTMRFFDPEMQTAVMERALLEADLRLGLTENQFKLYFQLQATHDRLIIGAEVLLRWIHPERGVVSPVDFIPLAEDTKLILPIGLWVLEMACAQLKSWADIPEMRYLQLAVNVSSHQFYQANFVEQVCAVLEKYAIQPNLLKLELTESLVLDDIDSTILKMEELRKIGVQFSMDDFGTGFSSLSYLTQLPLDQLKIDQSFVRNIGVKSSDAVIVQTIIGMADNLGIGVIAEGVETEEQRAFLELNGCPAIQGYLFGRPVPIEQFEALLKKGLLLKRVDVFVSK